MAGWGTVNSNRRYGCIVFELLAEHICHGTSEKVEKGILQRLCAASYSESDATGDEGLNALDNCDLR